MTLPPILTMAGSDASCGAGVQADLKAITALGGYALNALTSVVSETPSGAGFGSVFATPTTGPTSCSAICFW